jgi:hypothetical protein
MMKFNNVKNTMIKQNGKEFWISRSCAVVGLVITMLNDEYYGFCKETVCMSQRLSTCGHPALTLIGGNIFIFLF